MNHAKPLIALGLIAFCIPVQAAQSARALLDKARERAISVPAFRRVDTTEQSATAIVGQNRVPQTPQTNVVTIEVDLTKTLARQTTTFGGQQLIMLKQGEKAAMKMGDASWQVPAGVFANLAKDLGNLFVCEKETPETKENAPVWIVTGAEVLDGDEAIVIETQGNTAVRLAQERMTEAIAKAFSGNPSARPTVKVLEYSAKHWIRKSDSCRLLAIQESKRITSVSIPGGTRKVIEQSSKATSRYSYDHVTIEIPKAAQEILSQ
ncbi:MAG: hypothetical protein WCO56_21220 [Verrucomicrobiota bacterium]